MRYKQVRNGYLTWMGPKQQLRNYRPRENRSRNESRLPANGPTARTDSDRGVPAGKKRGASTSLQKLGGEYQLQFARCFRLGLPVLGFEKLGIGNKPRIDWLGIDWLEIA
jgi:hypothetical protein